MPSSVQRAASVLNAEEPARAGMAQNGRTRAQAAYAEIRLLKQVHKYWLARRLAGESR